MTPQAPSTRSLPNWAIQTLWALVTLSLPVFLVLTGVRLVMTDAFLQIEYRRPGFPADHYGFTRADRLHYAPYAVDYLHGGADLAALTFPDGEPLYRPKELQHMADVKAVTDVALSLHTALTIGLLAVVLLAVWRPGVRIALRRGLADGGALTLALILALLILVVFGWNLFFESFHRILFEGDSWQFSTSDTLIRLFPQQFWFDAALAIGAITVVGAVLAMLAARVWSRRAPVQRNHA